MKKIFCNEKKKLNLFLLQKLAYLFNLHIKQVRFAGDNFLKLLAYMSKSSFGFSAGHSYPSLENYQFNINWSKSAQKHTFTVFLNSWSADFTFSNQHFILTSKAQQQHFLHISASHSSQTRTLTAFISQPENFLSQWQVTGSCLQR